MRNNEKSEKLRSFESLFFNLINAQKNLFDTFNIDYVHEEKTINLIGSKAVMKIENGIEEIREKYKGNEKITECLEELDKNDQIFGLSRAFYIMILMIQEKLCDSEGFTKKDRAAHFKALINFTDFAQLRLIMICIQFMDYESCKYIRSSSEFESVIKDLGLNYELY